MRGGCLRLGAGTTPKPRAFGRVLSENGLKVGGADASRPGGPRGMLGIVVRCKFRVLGVEATKSKVWPQPALASAWATGEPLLAAVKDRYHSWVSRAWGPRVRATGSPNTSDLVTGAFLQEVRLTPGLLSSLGTRRPLWLGLCCEKHWFWARRFDCSVRPFRLWACRYPPPRSSSTHSMPFILHSSPNNYFLLSTYIPGSVVRLFEHLI